MSDAYPSPKRHRLKKITVVFGSLIALIVIGVIWSKVLIQDDPNVTAAEREALSIRLHDTQTVSLGLVFPVVETRITQFNDSHYNGPVSEYAAEYYTLFGIRQRRAALDCWDVRPGIDGVRIGDIDPIGTLRGTVWCDGIAF